MYATRHRQRGAATIIAAVFLVVTIALMALVSVQMAGSDINDTAMHSDAVEALFIAESGIESASYDFASGTACLDLAPAGPVTIARGNFTVTNAYDTDYAGVALPAGQCRIDITGTAGVLNAARHISAIIQLSGGNLLENDNADFNDPEVGPGPPDGWVLSAWDDTGGPDGSRSAYVEKPTAGNQEFTTAGSFGMSGFTVTAPTTLQMDFDFNVVRDIPGGPQKAMALTFRLIDSVGNVYTHATYFSPHTGGYTSDSVAIDITGAGTVDIAELEFDLVAKAGRPKDIWLDNLVLTEPGTPVSAGPIAWRERVQ